MDIRIEKIATPKQKPDESSLGFGQYFTDHMFIMDYTREKGWHDARIVPFGNLCRTQRAPLNRSQARPR